PGVDKFCRRLPLRHNAADMATHETHRPSLTSFNAAVLAEPGGQERRVGQVRPDPFDRPGKKTPEGQALRVRNFTLVVHCLSLSGEMCLAGACCSRNTVLFQNDLAG